MHAIFTAAAIIMCMVPNKTMSWVFSYWCMELLVIEFTQFNNGESTRQAVRLAMIRCVGATLAAHAFDSAPNVPITRSDLKRRWFSFDTVLIVLLQLAIVNSVDHSLKRPISQRDNAWAWFVIGTIVSLCSVVFSSLFVYFDMSSDVIGLVSFTLMAYACVSGVLMVMAPEYIVKMADVDVREMNGFRAATSIFGAMNGIMIMGEMKDFTAYNGALYVAGLALSTHTIFAQI